MSETLRDKLTRTPEGMRLYLREEAILDFSESVLRLMEKRSVTSRDIWVATPGLLTQRRLRDILEGDTAVPLEIMVDILHRLGHKLVLTVGPLEKSP